MSLFLWFIGLTFIENFFIMKTNMGSVDRIIRFIIAVSIGVLFFSNVISGAVGIILLIVAIIILLTSLTGYCPLYTLFRTSSKKKIA